MICGMKIEIFIKNVNFITSRMKVEKVWGFSFCVKKPRWHSNSLQRKIKILLVLKEKYYGNGIMYSIDESKLLAS